MGRGISLQSSRRPAVRRGHSMNPITIAYVGVLGLIIGSFLTVVVHRVPAGASIVSPRSSCP